MSTTVNRRRIKRRKDMKENFPQSFSKVTRRQKIKRAKRLEK